MARVTYVKKAQPRYRMVPMLNADGTQKTVPVMRRNGEQKTTKKGKTVTRKITVADKSQPLPNHTCGKCGVEIKVGDSYKWVQPKSGPYGGYKRFRCATCPSWRPSELTSSPALSVLYAAQEAADDNLASVDEGDVDALCSMLEELAEGVREAGEVYEESASNMEDGFGHETSMSEELREKAKMLTDQADEIEYAANDLTDWDGDEPDDEDEEETERYEEWWNAQLQIAEDATYLVEAP